MSHIEIKKVSDKKMRKEFVKLPWTAHLYDDDPIYVPQLIGEQMHFLDPAKGYFFENGIGEADLFIAYKDDKPVGRISAHICHRYEKKFDTETGFFGFYESTNDRDVAGALFETAEKWVKDRGKTRILGPESFTIYDPIGFIEDGFEISPVVGLYHNAPYYRDLAAHYGFKKAIDWYCLLVDSSDSEVRPFLTKVKDDIMKTHLEQGISYREVSKKEIKSKGATLRDIFNTAWEGNWGHLPFTNTQFKMLFKELSNFVVPELALFAEKDGKNIGFILSIPDVNPALRKLNGHLYPWRIVQFLSQLRKSKLLRTILMGVLPEYRGQGIDAVLVLKTIENANKIGMYKSDCSLIVETNVKMINSLKPLKAKNYKTYRLYEKPIS